MTETIVWNVLLTGIVAFIGYVLKDKSDEVKRLSILLNRTREEIAKEYVTKAEVHADIGRVLDRLERLDQKIDLFLREAKNAQRQ
ncbi:MAG: hypothetical protein FGM53_07100 [Rhodocyclaceae bacterium]|nr:hypothetical protein [Rhodocyclaceae bacterium]